MSGGEGTVLLPLQDKEKGGTCFSYILWFICWYLLLFTFLVGCSLQQRMGIGEKRHEEAHA